MPNESTLEQLRDAWLDAESKASEALVAYEAAAASGASVAEASKVVGLAQHAAHLAKLAYEDAREKAPLTAIAEESEAAAAESSRRIDARYAKEMTAIKWKMGLIGTLIAGAALAIIGGSLYLVMGKRPVSDPVVRMKGEPLGSDAGSAQAFCEENIRKVARDPDTVKVPFVRNQGGAGEHVFHWGRQTSMVRMHNGMGLEVPVEVTCMVNSTSGRITSLVIDGKQIITGLSK